MNNQEQKVEGWDEYLDKLAWSIGGEPADGNLEHNEVVESLNELISTHNKAIREEIITYFGHIENDGVTGKPINLSMKEITKDILNLPILNK